MNTAKPAHAYTPPNASESDESAAPLLAIKLFNFVVAMSLILFVWSHAMALADGIRMSVLIMLAKAVLEVQFYVRKSTLQFVKSSAYAWFIALCGAVAALLFRPSSGSVPDVFLATGLQTVGLLMLLYIICTLHRSGLTEIGRRGVLRDGLYRFVRHPIHLAFAFGAYGYVLNHTTGWNLCVLGAVTVLQVLRLREEEEQLRGDDEFQDYAAQTRWQVIPKVF